MEDLGGAQPRQAPEMRTARGTQRQRVAALVTGGGGGGGGGGGEDPQPSAASSSSASTSTSAHALPGARRSARRA